jgi:hypothetical protein
MSIHNNCDADGNHQPQVNVVSGCLQRGRKNNRSTLSNYKYFAFPYGGMTSGHWSLMFGVNLFNDSKTGACLLHSDSLTPGG